MDRFTRRRTEFLVQHGSDIVSTIDMVIIKKDLLLLKPSLNLCRLYVYTINVYTNAQCIQHYPTDYVWTSTHLFIPTHVYMY